MPSRAQASRRVFLGSVAALAALRGGPLHAQGGPGPMLAKPIPASGEALPVIGMGTWITFNVGDDPGLRAQRVEVLRGFFDRGGTLIDSSPMYGTSEEVIGHCLARLGPAELLPKVSERLEPSRRPWILGQGSRGACAEGDHAAYGRRSGRAHHPDGGYRCADGPATLCA